MKRMIIFGLIAAVAMFGAVMQSHACGWDKMKEGFKDGGSGTFIGGGMGFRNLEKLGLTDEQKASIKAAGEKMKQAVQSGDREQMKAAAAAFRSEIEKFLTDEQRAKLAEFKGRMVLRFQGEGGGTCPFKK